MIEVDSFILRNIVYFNEAKVPVRKNNGFVIISGLNKDSRIAEDQNNGAGKSLLWSAFPNALYAAAPSSTAKNTKKDMLDSSKSEIEIRFKNNRQQKVKVVQKPSKWLVYEEEPDGSLKDIKSHRVSNQQEKIAEHFPLSQDEFYAYTYLSSIQGQRLHFQVEKPAERLKFITSIFQLDAYDKLKKYFTNMLGRIKDEQTRFSVLESKLLNANVQLERIQWTEESVEKAKRAKESFADLKVRRDSIARSVSKGETRVGQIKSLVRLLEKKEALGIPEDTDVDDMKAKLCVRMKIIRDYEAYLKELKSYQKRVSKIEEALEELNTKDLTDKKTLNKKLPKLHSKAEDLVADIERARESERKRSRLADKVKECRKELKSLGFSSADDVDTDTDLDDDISICRTTLQLKKLLDSSSDSTCPTCMQSVDLKSIKTSVKKAEKRLKKLETLNKARRVLTELQDFETELESVEKVDSVDSLKETLNDTKSKIQAAEKELKLHGRLQELKEQLAEEEEPKAPKKTPPKNASIDDIDEKLALLNEFAKIDHSIEVLIDGSSFLLKASKSPEKALSKTKIQLDDLSAQLAKLDAAYKMVSKLVSEYDLRLGEYRVLSKQKIELEAELEEIKPILEKRDLYKALEKAYSAKGLKVSKANEIVRLLEANLNRYSNLIFAEPFTFKVYATEQGVFCDVDRNSGKDSDVRLLSGSESDSFRLLFMLSLLLMVPSDRRTNFVVLDEPESHMDPRTRNLFAERYIPFLREVVPHLFLITPQDHHIYSDFDHWTVEKANGVSTLKINSL